MCSFRGSCKFKGSEFLVTSVKLYNVLVEKTKQNKIEQNKTKQKKKNKQKQNKTKQKTNKKKKKKKELQSCLN